jgi:hypothetical protein
MKNGPGPSSSGPSSSGNQYARVQVAALPFESSHGQHTRLDGAARLGSGTRGRTPVLRRAANQHGYSRCGCRYQLGTRPGGSGGAFGDGLGGAPEPPSHTTPR